MLQPYPVSPYCFSTFAVCANSNRSQNIDRYVHNQHYSDHKQNILSKHWWSCERERSMLFSSNEDIPANKAHRAVCLDMAFFSRWQWRHSLSGCPRKQYRIWNTPKHVYKTLPVSGVETEAHQCVRCARACVLWARDRLSAHHPELAREAPNLSAQRARRRERAPLWNPVPKILLLFHENGPFTGRTRSLRIYCTCIFFSVHAQGFCGHEISGFESGAAELRRILSRFTSEEKIVSADANDERKHRHDTNRWGVEE